MPVLALTATATQQVRADILEQLSLRSAITFRQSFNRDNLRYEVRHKQGRQAGGEIASWIRQTYPDEVPSGIIYCLRKRDCDELAKELSEQHGISAAAYHADLSGGDRAATQRRWMNDEVAVVVATIAFGMGINKADVRFVIHYALPKSMEGYYQESGRAGRDGAIAHCILYYNYSDKHLVERMIKMPSERDNEYRRPSPENVARQMDHLLRMVAYCENLVDCRRVLQLSYFGETFAVEHCNSTCDNCLAKTPVTKRDVLGEAQAIVALGT